jgi:putative transcriptional regulator
MGSDRLKLRPGIFSDGKDYGSRDSATAGISFGRAAGRVVGLLFACLALGLLGPSARGGQNHESKMQFLVARNEVRDPFFWHSVVLMLPTTSTSIIVGIIVNKPSRVALSKLFPESLAPENRTEPAYFGGPVDVDIPSVVFRSSTAPKKALRLYGNVYLTFDSDLITASLQKSQPSSKVRLFLGRAQWAPGQLRVEVSRGGWYRIPADGDLIFSSDPDSLWQKLHAQAAPSRYVKYEAPYGSRAGAQARAVKASPALDEISGMEVERGKLPFDFEADFQHDLKLLDLAILYPAALLDNFEPVHVPKSLCGFSNARLDGFSEAHR